MRFVVRHRNGRALYWIAAAGLAEASSLVADLDKQRPASMLADLRGQTIEPMDDEDFQSMPRTFKAARAKT